MAIKFSWLEETISTCVVTLLQADAAAGAIVLAEASFRAKVNMLASLVRERSKERTFNTAGHDPSEMFAELAGFCFKAEELRNQLMHSSWEGCPDYHTRSIVRRKTTAKARRGLTTQTQVLNGDEIMDIADFISCVDSYVDEFFIEP